MNILQEDWFTNDININLTNIKSLIIGQNALTTYNKFGAMWAVAVG